MIWLAAVWGRHVHDPVAADWFGRETGDIAFCRVTQTGLLRLLSNPAIMREDVIDRSQAGARGVPGRGPGGLARRRIARPRGAPCPGA